MNVHLYPSNFKNESRIEKQASFLSNKLLLSEVLLIGAGKGQFQIDGIEVVLLGRENVGGFFSKLLTFSLYYYEVLRYIKGRDLQFINVHSLSVFALGYILKLTHGAKLIYDTHELETETSGSKGLRKKLSKLVEWLLIGKADHIFVVSDNIADWYRDTYKIARPTVVFNAPPQQFVEKSSYFRDKYGLRDDQIIILYQGALAEVRGVDLLLEVFRRRIDDKVVIVFMGYGTLEKKIQDASKSYNTIFFHEAVSPALLLHYTASADSGIHVIKNTCLNHNYCMPNKLFQYAMAGLPVIVSNMKEMRDFVLANKIGVVVEEDTVDSVDKAIEKLLVMDLAALKENAIMAAFENSWEHQEQKMRVVYQKLLESA